MIMPTIGNTQLKLLEKLCNAVAVSGDEGEVRSIVMEEIKGHCDAPKVDALGNVLAIHQGTAKKRLRIMVAAHMDEVGFMLVGDDNEGLFRFETVGGMDVRQLVGKPVWVGKEHTPGVIGARPIHLTTAEERRKTIPLDALRIDIGPGGKAALGDRATFATKFQRSGASIFAKALDNRFGVSILIELLKNAPANIDLMAAFTVQEENGLRGAKVAAHALDPQVGIAVDSTPANDLPQWEDEENAAYNTRLGLGPALYIADGSTFSDPRLVRHFLQVAETEKIPCQVRQPGGGGTDAGTIHRARAGIPSLSVSIPHRYAHTAVLVARVEDWKNTLNLLHAALSKMQPSLLAGERI
jgi:putative aminopeptidase FrvX